MSKISSGEAIRSGTSHYFMSLYLHELIALAIKIFGGCVGR